MPPPSEEKKRIAVWVDLAASAWEANLGLAAVVDAEARDDDKIRRADNRPVDEEEDRSMMG